MKTVLLGYLGLLCFKTIQSACPSYCLDNTDCDVEPDNGCPQCTEAYYGRQCQYRLECFLGGIDTYMGLLNTTENGHTCQAWNVNTPHYFNMPENKANEGNYCRKSTSAEVIPWCYTTNPGIRIEVCTVPWCDEQCKAPPQFPDLSLINPAEPGMGFYDGYTALFVCPDNAKVKSVCRSNTWSEVSCSDICRWQFNGSEQVALQLGERAHIQCPIGYELNNSTCLTDNNLSESPECQIISCGKPDFLTEFHHEDKIKGSYNYQDILNISCIRGYESNTTTEYTLFTCSESKNWIEGKPFLCSVIRCDSPQLQNNSLITSHQRNYIFKSKIVIGCEDGYELVGNSHFECLANKSWSGQFPICKAIECNTSGIETYGRRIEEKKDNYFYNDTIHIVCQNDSENLNKTQESFHRCKNKIWNGTFVVCNAKDSVKFETCQFQQSSFGAGLATGVGSSIAVFSITFVIWYLAVRKKPDCSVSQTNASFANNYRNPYEDNAIAKENEHIYLELNSTRIQPNTTYCNTDVQ